MSTESSIYVGFIDGARRYTQNSSLAIYTPTSQALSSGGVCLWPSLNNVVEYSFVIELLRDSILHGIYSLEVCLDLQFMVSQLNDMYHVRNSTLL